MRRNFRYTGRSLLKAPGFTSVVVLVISIGVGADTAFFGIMERTTIQPVPHPEPERLVLRRAASTEHLQSTLVVPIRISPVGIVPQAPDLQSKSEKGATLLHGAAEDGSIEIVASMLSMGLDINVRDDAGATPLFYAARGGQVEATEYLVANGADVHATDYLLATPLHYLFENRVSQRHLETMELLIAEGVQVDARQWWGERVLMYAISRRNMEALELLLSAGSDVNTGTVDNSTPLHYAARGADRDIVSLLLDRGATPNVYNSSGLTPLHAAAAGGHTEIVELLLSRASTDDYRDRFNRTPLHFAAYSGNRDLCHFLIKRGFDVHARDDDARTPLHWAAWRGQADAAALLIENGALINVEDLRGQTPLHLAAVSGDIESLGLLIGKGATLNVGDRDGRTPLDLARAYERPRAEEILVEHNAVGRQTDLNAASFWLTTDLKDNEAIVWNLGWSGWAVKTKRHLLIFDYWAQDPGEAPSLGNGHINPAQIQDLEVVVFISHEHGDHFDPAVLEWAETVKSIKYVFGWKPFDNPVYNYLSETREQREIGDIEVTTLHARSDVHEAAFLVKADGVVVFHPGDYTGFYTGREDTYKAEYDFLSKIYDQVDIAFLPNLSESNEYMLNSLSPKIAFPQHSPEYYTYKGQTQELEERIPNVRFFYAENRGERFFYSNGKLID